MPTFGDRKKMIADALEKIRMGKEAFRDKRVTIGFDGFVDTLVRIIKNKDEKANSTYFTRIREFGEYITEKSGSSFSLEVEQQSIKLGGNVPIMANALGRLGLSVNCIGAFGYPNTHPVFKSMSSNCHFYSFADPGTSTACEFPDGKILLGNMGELNRLGWEEIKQAIGIEKLIQIFDESSLLGLVNWSEPDASTNIWKGLLKDVFPHLSGEPQKPIVFVDLSDCSKRSKEAIEEMLGLLVAFRLYAKVILGLNKNESRFLCKLLSGRDADEELESIGKMIAKKLPVDILVLHSSRKAIAFDGKNDFTCDSFFVASPAVSTGAGDNFSAGFAAACLAGADLPSSLVLANGVAALYISTGMSPEFGELIQFLEQEKNKTVQA